MNSTNKFILELNAPVSQRSIPVQFGDTARVWEITFSDKGKAYRIEDGVLAKIEIRRPTGTIIERFCPVLNNTTVEYEFDENTAIVEGIHKCGVVFYNSEGKVLGSALFMMVVSERAIDFDDYVVSDEDYTAVNDIIAREVERSNNEATRISNENTREQNEKARKESEVAREAAEERRETSSNELKKELEETIDTVEKKLAQGEFDGEDGFSPVIETSKTSDGYELTITDVNGTKTIEIKDGPKGEEGDVADYSITMELDHETYKLKLSLKDEDGNVVSEDVVDFPIENVVVSGDEENGIVTLTLINGNTIEFEIGDLVAGLVSTTTFETKVKQLEASINASELSANKVTSLNGDSTDAQYPSAKCVYNELKALRESIPTYTTAEGVSF